MRSSPLTTRAGISFHSWEPGVSSSVPAALNTIAEGNELLASLSPATLPAYPETPDSVTGGPYAAAGLFPRSPAGTIPYDREQ